MTHLFLWTSQTPDLFCPFQCIFLLPWKIPSFSEGNCSSSQIYPPLGRVPTAYLPSPVSCPTFPSPIPSLSTWVCTQFNWIPDFWSPHCLLPEWVPARSPIWPFLDLQPKSSRGVRRDLRLFSPGSMFSPQMMVFRIPE